MKVKRVRTPCGCGFFSFNVEFMRVGRGSGSSVEGRVRMLRWVCHEG